MNQQRQISTENYPSIYRERERERDMFNKEYFQSVILIIINLYVISCMYM